MSDRTPSLILKKLEDSGFEAYYVGGCVRDFLLNRPIHDWDITTSASPEQIMSCFPHCIPTGIRHGTVTVIEGPFRAEITTFRCDGDYHDGRHPDQVAFVRNLEEDLARRDFTINAIAMDRRGKITDLHEGQADLRRQIIRTVGDPDRRFREDALRMLRALRFSAQLDFEIEKQTLRAIQTCAPLVSVLSVERIRDEIEKVLMSGHPQVIASMVRLGLLRRFPLVPDEDYDHLNDVPCDRALRWAALCKLCPSLDLSVLRLDKHTASSAMEAALLAGSRSRQQWKFCIAEHGIEIARITAALSAQSEIVEEILSSGECLFLKDLAVSGADFPALKGREIGTQLRRILMHILLHPEDNSSEKIRKIFSLD